MAITNSLFSRSNYKTVDLTVKTAAIASGNWENVPEIEKKTFFENLFRSFAKDEVTDTQWKDLDLSLSKIILQEHQQATKANRTEKKSELTLLMHEVQTLTSRTLTQFPKQEQEEVSPVFRDLEPIFLEASEKSYVVYRGALTGQVFPAMLEGRFSEKKDRRIRFDNFTNRSDAFDSAIRFLRGERIDTMISYQNIQELWLFAATYDLQELEAECYHFFKTKFKIFSPIPKEKWPDGFLEMFNFYLSMFDKITVPNQGLTKIRQGEIVSWVRQTIEKLTDEKVLEFFSETIKLHVENGVSEFLLPVVSAILEKTMELVRAKLHLSNGKLFFLLPGFELSLAEGAFSMHLFNLLRTIQNLQGEVQSLISGYAVKLDMTFEKDKDPVINYNEYIKALERVLGNIFFYEGPAQKLQRTYKRIIFFVDFASLTYEGKTEKEIEQMFKDNFENGFRHSSKHKDKLEGLSVDFINSKEFVELGFEGLFDSPQVELSSPVHYYV